MKVLWLTFIPSPYRLSFFEELGKQCELTVLFERASSKTRKNNWDDFVFRGYQATVLPGITIGGYDRLCLGVSKYLNCSYDKIVISNPTSPTGILAAAILRMKRIPYVVESDGAFPTGRTGGIRQKLKRFVMASAQLCFSTAQLHDQYYQECGVKETQLRRYPFTSLFAKDVYTGEHITQQDREDAKRLLNMTEQRVVLAVGQFVHRKGFDILLEAARKLPRDIGFYFVGDVPPDSYTSFVTEHQLTNVHFLGFQKKEKIGLFYTAADLFVLPTREDIWGLVINEAMAYGLPVITTDRCIAGLELVTNDENGYIVPVGDVEQTAQRIGTILDDPALCASMGQCSLRRIQAYTFENMSNVHMAAFQENGE